MHTKFLKYCFDLFEGNLRAHVVRLHSIPHNQETVYQCSDCSCVFRKLGSLNAHHNRMHPTSNPPPQKVSILNLSTAFIYFAL